MILHWMVGNMSVMRWQLTEWLDYMNSNKILVCSRCYWNQLSDNGGWQQQTMGGSSGCKWQGYSSWWFTGSDYCHQWGKFIIAPCPDWRTVQLGRVRTMLLYIIFRFDVMSVIWSCLTSCSLQIAYCSLVIRGPVPSMDESRKGLEKGQKEVQGTISTFWNFHTMAASDPQIGEF